MNKATPAQLLSSLEVIADECFSKLDSRTKEQMLKDIARLQEAGWLDNEIVQYMRNIEDVSPHLTEEVQLQRMQAVRTQVFQRIHAQLTSS